MTGTYLFIPGDNAGKPVAKIELTYYPRAVIVTLPIVLNNVQLPSR